MQLKDIINNLIHKDSGTESAEQIRRVAGNFVYLSILNFFNILLPLITLPYLMHTVGKANYGIYSYVYMVVQYVIIFATYGFNLSATKQISQCRDDNEKVKKLFEKYDLNKNGVIDPDEFMAIMMDILKQLGEELPEKKHREVAEEGLQRFDLDNNGKIDYNEFFDFINFVVSEKGYTL